MTLPPQIFDRALRRQRRDRAAAGPESFLIGLMAEEILDRLDGVQRSFARALDLGCGTGVLGRALAARGVAVTSLDAGPRFATAAGGLAGEEDGTHFPPESFDLIVSAGVLDQVNDLPGALALARRALAPDGLFMAVFPGAGSLPALRTAMAAADEAEGSGASPRLHPQIDVRSAGDLLARAGFTLPVADTVTLSLRYPHLFGLVRDLRAAAATNILARRNLRPLSRRGVAAAAEAFAGQADADGKTTERLALLCMTGWAPHPEQPQPAKRGSGTASLAQAFRPPSPPPEG